MNPNTDAPVLRYTLRSVDALLDTDGSPFAELPLRPELVERLIADADSLPGTSGLRLEFSVPEASVAEIARIRFALRTHFEAEAALAVRDRTSVFRRARRATLIGLVVVVVLLGVANSIDPDTSSRFLRGVRESLTIFAWVAMWRPAELWLYEHLPLWRRRAMAQLLAAAELSVISRNPAADAPSRRSVGGFA